MALEVCMGRRHKAVALRRVLLEAQRNIASKFGTEEMLRYYRLLADVEPEVVEPPSQSETEEVAEIVNAKDAHVLAAALKSGCGYLLTLDRGFFTDRLLQAALPLRVMTPGDFLNHVVRRGK